ncbi:MAG: hypothetical protein HWE27_00420 [Gammaproteobacteria bacterium]|nr:hypothetical protein [Gammaproteobacteria bacterium]
MQSREFLLPGVASFLLAILFPIYWGSIYGMSFENFETAFINDLATFDLMDGLFIIIGALEVYIYVSLARKLNQQFDSTALKTLLYLMATVVIVLHSTVLFDIYLSFRDQPAVASIIETMAGIILFTAIGVLISYSVLGFILSIILLKQRSDSVNLLKIFSVIVIIMCVLQITVVFSFTNIFLFPIALIVLALYFFKQPETVEVV